MLSSVELRCMGGQIVHVNFHLSEHADSSCNKMCKRVQRQGELNDLADVHGRVSAESEAGPVAVA